jgi:hypothetical protein
MNTRYIRESTIPIATICSPSQASPHFRRVPNAVSSQLGVHVGRIESVLPKSPAQIGSGVAEW